jgi:DNA-binding response OmpR family regulator
MNSEDQTPYRALIIDDQPTICSIYSKILKDLGVTHVETASSGVMGLKSYMTEFPDIVLLDVCMPGMNGLDVMTEIRAIDTDSNVIMLTSVSDKETVIASLRKGARSYILKTEEAGEVKQRLSSIFKKLDFNRNRIFRNTRKSA